MLATVGSTHFDPLINSLTTQEALAALNAAGVSDLVLQFGRGQPYLPSASMMSSTASPRIESFAYTASLVPKLSRADIVVTHCGAGSVFEALRLRRHVVAVPNRTLMDDHQTELADALSGVLRVAQVGPAVVDQVVHACRDVRNGVKSSGDANVPRNGDAIASIVCEELHHLNR